MQPVRSLLTSDNLRRHASGAIMQQGQEYFGQNNVRVTYRDDARIIAQVADPTTNNTYNTTLTGSDFGLSWQCTCGSSGGSSGEGAMCAHSYAAALAAQRG
jgi:uncharacterized Zn finger protein